MVESEEAVSRRCGGGVVESEEAVSRRCWGGVLRSESVEAVVV